MAIATEVQTTPRGAIPADNFGDRLRRSRRFAGLKVQELADAVSVAAPTITQWELSSKRPRDQVGAARKIAEVCGVDYIWLLTGDAMTRGCLVRSRPIPTSPLVAAS